MRRPTPNQLPTGRHGLSRDYVVGHQQERIHEAIVFVCNDIGYTAMSVEDIILASGTSRRTFYDQFRNKREAFLVSYGRTSDELVAATRDACDATAPFADNVVAALRAVLEFAATHPSAATFLLECATTEPEVTQRRAELQATFTTLLRDAANATLAKRDLPPEVSAEIAVSGIEQLLSLRLRSHSSATVPAQLPSLVEWVLLPYIGSTQARAARQQVERDQAQAARSAARGVAAA